jgi:dihydrofolate synthase/folylpolyglutamate synthase
MPPSYTETLDYLCHLHYGIVPGLERIRQLLSHLSDPHLKFPSVHIGGTNGKGSTAAITASILKQAGYKTGLYTSPHLIDFSERITINSIPIAQQDIIRLTDTLKREVAQNAIEPTFFEFTTAMAFCYFAESNIDIAVCEVGLGGRFDATNVLCPEVTAITNIDRDHEKYLGRRLMDIAYEKAGIIKAGTPVVTGATQPEVLFYLEEVARLKSAPLFRLGQEIRTSGKNPQEFLYEHNGQKKILHAPLLGLHQINNAAIAVGVIEQLNARHGAHFLVPENAILEGVEKVDWPGRLQIIQSRPLILLDGAHNPSGAQALASYLQEKNSNPSEKHGKHYLIVGIMRDKNMKDILSPLAAWADEVILTLPNIERAAPLTDIASALSASLSHTAIESIPEAIKYVLSRIGTHDTLVITGSLFTVAEALAHFKGIALPRIRG